MAKLNVFWHGQSQKQTDQKLDAPKLHSGTWNLTFNQYFVQWMSCLALNELEWSHKKWKYEWESNYRINPVTIASNKPKFKGYPFQKLKLLCSSVNYNNNSYSFVHLHVHVFHYKTKQNDFHINIIQCIKQYVFLFAWYRKKVIFKQDFTTSIWHTWAKKIQLWYIQCSILYQKEN